MKPLLERMTSLPQPHSLQELKVQACDFLDENEYNMVRMLSRRYDVPSLIREFLIESIKNCTNPASKETLVKGVRAYEIQLSLNQAAFLIIRDIANSAQERCEEERKH